MWFLPVVFLTNFYSNTLGAIDEQIYVLKVTILSAVFNIVANFIVVPVFAQFGASIVSVLTALLGFVFLVVKMRRKIASSIPLLPLSRVVLATLATLPLLIVKPDLHVLVLLGSSVVIYFIALVVFRAVTIREIKWLFLSFKSPASL